MAFTKSAVEELSALHREPDWLRARRLTSFGIYEGLAVPDTKRQEDWRQVDLKGLDLEGYAPFQQPNGTAPLGALENVGATLRQRGTSPAVVAIAPELTRQGVIFMPLAEAARVHPELVQRYLFTGITPERDKFAALHAALFSGGSFLYVPDGVTIDDPLVSQFWSAGSGAAVLPHSLVIGGKGSRFQYVDEFLSADRQEAALASGSAEVFLEEGANVGYVALQHWSIKTWQFANQRFQLGRDSHLNALAIALGGQVARLRVEAILEGPGSTAGASPIPWPSGCWSRGFSGRSWTGFRSPRFERRSIRNWPRGLSSVTQQRVASTSELPKESMKRVEVDGEPICLIHAEDDKFYAIGDTCTHEEYSLCEGELWEMSVECPRHGSRFDVRTGQVTGLPAVIPAKTYPVTIQNEDVYVEVGD